MRRSACRPLRLGGLGFSRQSTRNWANVGPVPTGTRPECGRVLRHRTPRTAANRNRTELAQGRLRGLLSSTWCQEVRIIPQRPTSRRRCGLPSRRAVTRSSRTSVTNRPIWPAAMLRRPFCSQTHSTAFRRRRDVPNVGKVPAFEAEPREPAGVRSLKRMLAIPMRGFRPYAVVRLSR